MTAPVASVEGLSLDVVAHGAAQARVVDNVSFAIQPGEICALVGESGSGKTMIARALIGLLPPAVRVAGGCVRFEGQDLATLGSKAMRSIRGPGIGMIFQDPLASLNPALTVGAQLCEGLRAHERLTPAEARQRAIAMLDRVRIPDPETALAAYPHQFSGGMRQRIMIASVLALRPRLLIADEPTTALDAIVAREVMLLMVALARDIGAAVLLVSHDLGLVAEHADHAVVLQKGRVVEAGRADAVILNPQQDYTRALVGALPERGAARPAGGPPLVEAEHVEVRFTPRRRLFAAARPAQRAVADVGLTVHRGETLAVVGESGSGKTTLGRAMLGLVAPASGSIRFDGDEVGTLSGQARTAFRRRAQMVFQDPWSSLDPRMRIGDAIAEALHGGTPSDRRERIAAALADVALTPDHAMRFPHELSGGQRQRVVIARAIIGRPDFIVADEPVSALDVTVQRQVLALLADLQQRLGFTTLFISHDLGVVDQVADRVAVMRRGRLIEIGSRDAVFDTPQHPYTRSLLRATRRIRRDGSGYRLAEPRAVGAQPPRGFEWSDDGGEPVMVAVAPGHDVACVPIDASPAVAAVPHGV